MATILIEDDAVILATLTHQTRSVSDDARAEYRFFIIHNENEVRYKPVNKYKTSN